MACSAGSPAMSSSRSRSTGNLGFAAGGGDKAPYLPHPYPLVRAGRERDSHIGGFSSLHDRVHGSCRPLAHPDRPCCPERVFVSHGEWWQAHQHPPGPPPPEPDIKTRATNFWPYGRRITDVVTTENGRDIYELDRRIVKNVIPFVPDRNGLHRTSSTGEFIVKREPSAPDCLGSWHEAELEAKKKGTMTRAHSSSVIDNVVGPPISTRHAGKVERNERGLPTFSCGAAAIPTKRNPGAKHFAEWRLPGTYPSDCLSTLAGTQSKPRDQPHPLYYGGAPAPPAPPDLYYGGDGPRTYA